MLRRSPASLTANERDRDMPHRRVGLGAVPMAFTRLDVHDITDIDLMLFMLRRHHAGARGDDQNLVAAMRVPPGGATLAEVHHAAVVVRRVPGLNDGSDVTGKPALSTLRSAQRLPLEHSVCL